jgi:hypothetical protein
VIGGSDLIAACSATLRCQRRLDGVWPLILQRGPIPTRVTGRVTVLPALRSALAIARLVVVVLAAGGLPRLLAVPLAKHVGGRVQQRTTKERSQQGTQRGAS